MKSSEADYVEGRRLIDAHIRKRFHLSSYDLFRSCWSLIEENSGKFKVRAALSEVPESAWRVLVHHDLVKYFGRLRPDFSPPLRVLAVPEGPAVMVTVHTGLELGILNALTSKGKPAAVIYQPSPQNSERTALYKPAGKPRFIEAGGGSLLAAAVALREGYVLLSDCDYPLPQNPRANAVRALSPAVFELAAKMGCELCFVLPFVDRWGHIDFRTQSAGVPACGASDKREDLVAFLEEAGMGWIEWILPSPD